MNSLNHYKNKRVFITGDTGFKGSWLSFWLLQLGAEVKGYSLAPNTQPSHFASLNMDMEHVLGDIRDSEHLRNEIVRFKPDIVFHLAAQPLVRDSYLDPKYTYETNVMGTINILDILRETDSVGAFVNVTTDKCYENKEIDIAYSESDSLGGYDPYSSSKACSEIVTSSFRNSYFNLKDYKKTHNCLLATARAGNVIGGGDWSKDRLIPDIIRAIQGNYKISIRNPQSTRPWQHVLEPLYGYLTLGLELMNGNTSCVGAWNFGPNDNVKLSVEKVVLAAKSIWNSFDYEVVCDDKYHEAKLLNLDSSKAKKNLGWQSILDAELSIKMTMNWYREFHLNQKILTASDINFYMDMINARNR